MVRCDGRVIETRQATSNLALRKMVQSIRRIYSGGQYSFEVKTVKRKKR